ncbi:DsbA family protein [Patescibacteria group bacterium]|nr:DsbA family protein [Patescibacteria group bacterium]MBU2068592.1 DsbA family protein [Patescibacteria group bacterium]
MNKNIYILGFIALIVLFGVIWFGSQNKDGLVNQTASILGDDQGQEIVIQEIIGDLVLGSPDAPVTIIEYSSHFCSHCVDFHNDTLPLLVEKYIKTGQVKLISRFIFEEVEVTMAILCAQEEGKSLELSEHIFKNIQDLKGVDDLILMVQAMDLNQENFNQCFNGNKYIDIIEKWLSYIIEEDTSTPTFFINGQKIVGNQPISVFEQAIEQALAQ